MTQRLVYTLINDTSPYHAGSEAAVRACREIADKLGFVDVGVDLLNLGNRNRRHFRVSSDVVTKALKASDLALINGEGGVDNPFVMSQIEAAIKANCRIQIWNCNWKPECSDRLKKILEKVELVILRGEYSLYNFKSVNKDFGISNFVFPDISLLCSLNDRGGVSLREQKVIFGDLHESDSRRCIWEGLVRTECCVPLIPRSFDWSGIVHTLRSGVVYVTGRHHGVYAALKALRPAIAIRRENFKMEDIRSFFSDTSNAVIIIDHLHEIADAINESMNHANSSMDEIASFNSYYSSDFFISTYYSKINSY